MMALLCIINMIQYPSTPAVAHDSPVNSNSQQVISPECLFESVLMTYLFFRSNIYIYISMMHTIAELEKPQHMTWSP